MLHSHCQQTPGRVVLVSHAIPNRLRSNFVLPTKNSPVNSQTLACSNPKKFA